MRICALLASYSELASLFVSPYLGLIFESVPDVSFDFGGIFESLPDEALSLPGRQGCRIRPFLLTLQFGS
jgi:hypothetical protein